MKIKFILPALEEAVSPFWRPIKYALFPPLGLATLAAFCAPEDEVSLWDEHVERVDAEDRPDLAVIETYITNAHRAYELADRYRQRGVYVALGGLHALLDQAGYDMLYVINRYRVLSQTPEEAAALLGEIEAASRLKATALVNNSHLGVETRLDTLTAALDFARKTAELTGLPLLYSTAPDFALRPGETLPEGFKPVKRYVRFLWE